MNQSATSKPAILILTGASGSGKTTLTLELDELSIPGVECINCDRAKVEVPETADPSDLQAAILRHWISELSREGREGPREGYVLLDQLRKEGDSTPLFFYAASNAPEHKRETREHGGQGCTNKAQELFEMVMRAVIQRQTA